MEVHVRWRGVALEGLRRGLRWIEERATFCTTSSVWLRREAFDAQVTGVERSLEALGDGRLASFSLHYEVALERQALGFLLTVARDEDGTLQARGFTRQDLVRPPLGARVAFEAIAGHTLDLEERLGAAGVSIGPDLAVLGACR